MPPDPLEGEYASHALSTLHALSVYPQAPQTIH